jgi:cation transport ATPase
MVLGMRHGIVFRSSEALLLASRTKAVAFDKTGTLSEGVLSVVRSTPSAAIACRIISELVSCSRHPVALAVSRIIVDSTSQSQSIIGIENKVDSVLTDQEIVPGGGIRATIFGCEIRGGNAAFTGLDKHNHPLVQEYLAASLTVFAVVCGADVIAVFGLVDQARPNVPELVTRLRASGTSTHVLSGDNAPRVRCFAQEVGIPVSSAHGGLLPTEKADIVSRLKKEQGHVTFVGDGINDSVALTMADTSIALGTGAQMAMSSASIVILGSDVPRLFLSIMDLSRLAITHVYLSLVWCAIYFTVAILLAAGVAVNFRIPPQFAGLGEVVSVLPVIMLAGSYWVAGSARMGRNGRAAED